jgi:hypothetical protein
VIRRLGLLLVLALTLLLAASVHGAFAQAPVGSVTIDVDGKLISLAPADANAFQRRLNQPPTLETTPPAAAPAYTVATLYWDEAVREDNVDEPPVDEEAQYFPGGGYVRAEQDGEEVWLVLDLRQRAILDHYIDYGSRQRLPDDPERQQAVLNPSALLVVFLAYYGIGETIGIQVGDRTLGPVEIDGFLASVAPHLIFQLTFPDPPQPPETDGSGYWVTFTLPEGRTLAYYLDLDARTLTDALGTETFDLSDAAGGGIPEFAETLHVEQEAPAGSQLWWLFGIGGGVALLALALLLQNWRKASTQSFD